MLKQSRQNYEFLQPYAKAMIQIKRTVLQPSTEAAKFYSKELSKMIRENPSVWIAGASHKNEISKRRKEVSSTLAKYVRNFWKDFSTNSTTYLQNFQCSGNSN